ncbi:MAG: hypothetical protein ACRDKL_08075 [Solirubrobacteraceae bacterium]
MPADDDRADADKLRAQVLHQSQDVLGRLAQDLIKLPAVNGALSTILEAREHATRAQELTMGALGIPSAADLERLTRRLRSVSQRLEALEDGIDRIVERLDAAGSAAGPAADLNARLARLEEALARIESALSPAP